MNEFVIRGHHAERAGFHHDLHLGSNGVFESWAVPKGVPARVNIRVLAIKTDAHSREGARFEGTIPKGQYGAGESEILDEGEYVMMTQNPHHRFFQLRGNTFVGNYYLRHWRGNHWLLWRRP